MKPQGRTTVKPSGAMLGKAITPPASKERGASAERAGAVKRDSSCTAHVRLGGTAASRRWIFWGAGLGGGQHSLAGDSRCGLGLGAAQAA